MAGQEPQLEQYMDVVRGVASALASRLPRDVDRDELEADGYEGLVKALRDYDSAKGPLIPYIRLRSRGAMIDGMRRRMLIPHGAHAAGAQAPQLISLEHELADGHRLIDVVPDPTPATDEIAIANASQPTIRSEVQRLPGRHRRIVFARFLLNRRRADVAAAEGVTLAELARVEARIRRRLRRALRITTKAGAPERRPDRRPRTFSLTRAELRVLRLAADGATAAETAARLRKAPETVKTQRRAIIAKLAARNMMNAVAISYERGLLH